MKENDLIGGKTALEYAIEHVVPEHLAEVSRRLTPEERLGPHQVPQEVVAKFAAPRLRQIVCSLPQFIEQPRILDDAAVGRHHPLAFPRQLSSTNDILLSARYACASWSCCIGLAREPYQSRRDCRADGSRSSGAEMCGGQTGLLLWLSLLRLSR